MINGSLKIQIILDRSEPLFPFSQSADQSHCQFSIDIELLVFGLLIVLCSLANNNPDELHLKTNALRIGVFRNAFEDTIQQPRQQRKRRR